VEVKAEIESLGAVRRKLTVTVPVEVVTGEFEKAYRSIQRKIVMPGYRRGHVPMKTVRQLYAGDVKGEVAQEMIPRAWREAIDSVKADPIGGPSIQDYTLEEGSPLSFTAEFDVRPEIKLPDYRGMKLVKEIAEVTEADVTAVLEDLRLKTAPVRTVEEARGARRGDIAVIDFEGFIGEAALPGGKGAEYPLELGSASFIPGFEDALVGALAGESREFTVTMPADYHAEEAAGKEVLFKVTVKVLKERVLPAFDDEFARDVGEYENLEDLRRKVHGNMTEVREKEARTGLKDRAIAALQAAVDFELPASLVEEEVENGVRNMARQLSYRGISVEEGKRILEESRDDLRQGAARRVKTTMILEEVAKAEGLTIGPEDLERGLREMAARYRKPIPELKKEMIKNGVMEGFRSMLLEEKALDLIVDAAEITVQPPKEAA
jgi:trigger factor